MELSGGDLEPRSPDPALHVSDSVATRQCLRERLGDRVAGQLGVGRVREDRSPELRARSPVDILDLGGPLPCILHLITTG